jgi:hypothetical protein
VLLTSDSRLSSALNPADPDAIPPGSVVTHVSLTIPNLYAKLDAYADNTTAHLIRRPRQAQPVPCYYATLSPLDTFLCCQRLSGGTGLYPAWRELAADRNRVRSGASQWRCRSSYSMSATLARSSHCPMGDRGRDPSNLIG